MLPWQPQTIDEINDPLSQAMITIKEIRRRSINHNREMHRRNIVSYPNSVSPQSHISSMDVVGNLN
jgi:hypothetical protein